MAKLKLLKFDLGSAGQPRTHHGHVMRKLGLDIVSGRYPEGAILPGDAELMEMFGVSRTVLREALKTLAAKGLIQPKAKIGTRVRERSRWNLFDPDILFWHFETGVDFRFLESLTEMRLALEPEAAALAALRRTEAHIEELYRWVDRMGDTEAREGFANSDLNFHLAVALASGNPFMRSVSALIEVALVAAFTISSPTEDPAAQAYSVACHRAIADAIRDRDPEGARAAMRVVILQGSDRVAGAMAGESTA